MKHSRQYGRQHHRQHDRHSGRNDQKQLHGQAFGWLVLSLVSLLVSTVTLADDIATLADDIDTLELTESVTPVVTAQPVAPAVVKKEFGNRVSLSVLNADVKALLQQIAIATNKNVVVSSDVQGAITLRLNNVTADQAITAIVSAQGLSQRNNGGVITITALQQESEQQALAPLQSRLIQINYAKASELANLLENGEDSILSSRGRVSFDERTNTLIVHDTQDRLRQLMPLMRKLDRPVQQVLIESRIVIARSDFSEELGVRFGASAQSGRLTTSGSLNGADNIRGGIGFDPGSPSDRVNVNLPVANPAGGVAFSLLGADYLIDLELSALQAEGRGEVISTPRLITANQRQASIEQGVEIPFFSASQNGTNVQFRRAVLELNVRPQITPDGRVVLDLIVNKDSVGRAVPTGIAEGSTAPTIDTRQIQTQVLVKNGETIVLGGIQEYSRSDLETKVPFLGDLPILGNLFRSTSEGNDRAELLIFVTPTIVDDRGVSGGVGAINR